VIAKRGIHGAVKLAPSTLYIGESLLRKYGPTQEADLLQRHELNRRYIL